jgi:hypothetical protein
MGRLRLPLFVAFLSGFLVLPGVVSAAILIDKISFDPPGPDTDANLNEEFVVITNTGDTTRSLGHWRLRDSPTHAKYVFPRGFKLKAGKSVRVHSGNGQDDHNDVYWNSAHPHHIWNNGGETAKLRSAHLIVKDKCAYGPSDSSPVNC